MTTMPTDFPTWYATVEAGQEAKASVRWAGVDKALANPQVDEVEAFIRYALKSRQAPDPAVASRIIENIRAGDPSFDTAAAGREIQILAASALAARLLLSDTAALALTTAHLDGARKPEIPMDLFAMAENAVISKAQMSRRRHKLEAVKAVTSKWTVTPEQAADLEPVAMAKALQEAVNKAIEGTVKNVNTVLKEFEKAQELADEELQMLWWLTGGQTSWGQPIKDLGAEVKPLAIGQELAIRTTKRPGPTAIPALLSRAGLSRTISIKVVDAVNAMGDPWSVSIVEGRSISPVTHPIHEAIRRRTETGAGADWVKNWSAVCEIDESHAVSALRLSELFYRERLLLTVAA